MSDLSAIEERVSLLEQELSRLKQSLGVPGSNVHWLDRFIGAFKDDPQFDEVARLGREYRGSQDPDHHG